jgi:hypothetical protein
VLVGVEPIRLTAMGRMEDRLDGLGLELPAPIVPRGNYEPNVPVIVDATAAVA